ncbi:MAG: universal stress protein [Ichthyobacteriaceae bacterium]|nr:universal stress protein [Ichthyobacteriaceae bacterium]
MSYSKILVAVEELPLAEKVFERAIELSKIFNAEIGIIHVINIPTSIGTMDAAILPQEALDFSKKTGENLLKTLIDKYAGDKKIEQFMPVGSPVSEVASTVKEFGNDLLIVGTHARSGFSKFFLGSIEEQLVSNVECEVLVIK